MWHTELITLAVSTILTAFFKTQAQKAKDIHEERMARFKNMREMAERTEGGVQQFFRGLIVMSLIVVMLFPTIAPRIVTGF